MGKEVRVWNSFITWEDYRILWFLPALELTPHVSTCLSWRKLTPPSNSFHMVMQPHSLVATRMTWTSQIDCLAGLHCTALYVPSIYAVQRHQSCAFRWHMCATWSACRTRLKLIELTLVLFPPPAGKYGLKLIVPAGSNQGNAVVYEQPLCHISLA